tara:strand:+ start:17594 stop:18775 length:1182 start_codon:yes stop_codon:yes gene_type:complete
MKTKCKYCVYENSHPFGISFINDCCSGCYTFKEKDNLDWRFRYSRLMKIINSNKSTQKYDCVVPVIGDAEDYFVVSEVLKLKLNPLLVSVNSYFLNDIGWKNLHNLFTHFDLDSIVYNPELSTYKELIRTSMRKYKHIMLPFLQLHTSFPVHIAKERGIKLVIWGANQSVEQVGKFSHIDEVEMTKWSRKEHDLFNVDIQTLIGNGAQVNERHLNYYRYPKIQKLGRNVKGIYLSNFIRWDPLKQNHSTLKYGFTPQKNNASFDIYERAGSSVYYEIHDLLKYERIGYRKLSDHITREVRHKRISIKEGVSILLKRENTKIFIKPFFNWLETSDSGYCWYLNHMLIKSKHLVSESPIEYDFPDKSLPKKISKLLTSPEKFNQSYIVFGKGVNI